MRINDITGAIVRTSIEIHRKLGPGLLESVYLYVLAHELRKQGFKVRTEVAMPVIWDGVQLEVGFRADLVVEDLVIVELKSQEAIAPVHKKQVLTYLRLADFTVGLLINFGVEMLKDGGIHRIVNGYTEEASSAGSASPA